jgi:hypothetical protein
VISTGIKSYVAPVPALVLTPPPEASADNDGLPIASKIAALKLNGDWVVLSACKYRRCRRNTRR